MTRNEVVCYIRGELLAEREYDADDIWSVCNLAVTDNMFYSLLNQWMWITDKEKKRGVWNLLVYVLKELRKKNL